MRTTGREQTLRASWQRDEPLITVHHEDMHKHAFDYVYTPCI